MERALRVQVNRSLTLDAGTLVGSDLDAPTGVRVCLPSTPMVEQAHTFFSARPAQPKTEFSIHSSQGL